MIFSLPTYLRYTRSVPCLLSSMIRKFLMNPSSFRISAIRSLSFDDGMSTFSCSARLALRMRVRKSAIGSLYMALPARLDHAGHLALERELAEADPARLELPQEAAGPAADLAARVGARLELRRTLLLHDERGLGHDQASAVRNGTPRCVKRAFASSSVRAVVTIVISMPRTLSTLAYTISGKMICSLSPML